MKIWTHTRSKACVSRLMRKPENGIGSQQVQSGARPAVCVTETDHSADYLRYVTGCLYCDVQVCNGHGDFTCLRPAGSIFISCCIFITHLTVIIGAVCRRGGYVDDQVLVPLLLHWKRKVSCFGSQLNVFMLMFCISALKWLVSVSLYASSLDF